MNFSLYLKKLFGVSSKRRANVRPTRAKVRPTTRLLLEELEIRQVPSTIVISSPTNWSQISGAPTSADSIIVTNGATLTVDTAATVGNIQLGANGSGAGTIVFSSSSAETLTVTGNLVVGASSASGTFNMSSVQSPVLNIAGALTLTSGESSFIAGTVSTVNYDGLNQTVAGTTYSTLEVSQTAQHQVNLGGNVTIASGLILNEGVVAAGTKTLTIDSGGTITRSQGTLASAPTFSGSVNVIYAGSTAITTGNELPSGSSVLATLTVNDPAGVTLNKSVTVNTELLLSSGSLINGSATTNTLTVGSSSGSVALIDRVHGALAVAPSFPGKVNVEYDGSVTTGPELPTSASVLGSLTIGSASNSGISASVTLNQNVTVNGPLTVVTNSSLKVNGTFTVTTTGNFVNNAGSTGFLPGSGTVVFAGTSAQTLSGVTNFNNLTMSGAGLHLSSNITVAGTLNFTSGNIVTGSSNLVLLAQSATVNPTSGYVAGALEEYVGSGSGVTVSFRIGAANYDPLSVTFASVSTAGYLVASVTSGDAGSISTSILNPNAAVNEYWSLYLPAASALAFSSTYSATFNFAAGDLSSGTSSSPLAIGEFAGGTWSYPTIGTETSTAIQATGLSSIGTGAASAIQFQVAQEINTSTTVTDNSSGSAGVGTTVTFTATVTNLQATASGAPSSSATEIATGQTFAIAVTADSSGDIFYGDTAGVYEIFASNSSVTQVYSNAIDVTALAFDKNGDLLIADGGHSLVAELTASQLADGSYSATTFASLPGEPLALAVDKNDDVFIATGNSGSTGIFEVKANSTSVTTVLSSGLYDPQGLAFDANGDLFIANYNGNILELAASSSSPTGLSSSATTFLTGIGDAAGLAFDGNGDLFIAGQSSQAIYEVPAGSTSAVVFSTSDVNYPQQISFDANGDMLVANQHISDNIGIDTGYVAEYSGIPMGTPTGSVEFYAIPTSGSAIDLGAGTSFTGSGTSITTELSTSSLSPGSYSIVAEFTPSNSGSGTVLFPSSGSETFTVIPAPVFSNVSVSPYNPSYLPVSNATLGGTLGASLGLNEIVNLGGSIYGTTEYGGSFGDGTFFEIPASSSAMVVLASFNSASGGASNPVFNVAEDSSGNFYGISEFGGASGQGAVWEWQAGSSAITTLASFSSASGGGYQPEGGIVLVDNASGSGGNIYGTTYYGGSSGSGTVFELASGSTSITTLGSFTGTNGANPNADLQYLGSNGYSTAANKLYGTTRNGGASGDGVIFEIPVGGGTITADHSFTGADGDNPYGQTTLYLEGFGDWIVGSTENGGSYDQGAVFSYVLPGAEYGFGNTFYSDYSFTGGSDGAHPNGITGNLGGTVYGTTQGGGDASGASGDGTIFDLTNVGEDFATLGDFNSATTGSDPIYGVTTYAGNVYGTTENGVNPDYSSLVKQMASDQRLNG